MKQKRSSRSSTMKHIIMAGDLPFLPEGIIRDILIRLPVKSLIRFQCVCKHWRNLIQTPSFISDHLHHSTRQNPYLLLNRRDLWLLDCKMQLHEVESAPLIDSSAIRILGSINGLVCVEVNRYSSSSPSLLLWNPATREFRHLPTSRKLARLPSRRHLYDIGFGFSPIINDYKIVIIYFDCRPYRVLLVVMYSLSSGKWKKVEFGVKNLELITESVTVNGSMFWIGCGLKQGTTDTFYDTIVSFDLANEVFTLITPPDWSIPRSLLTMYENKLAVLCFSEVEDSESLIELWVMEDSTGASWAKKCSGCLFPCLVRSMTIWMNQIVCHGTTINDEHQRTYESQKINLLNISTNELKTLDISQCGRDGPRHSSTGFGHAESLVPIGRTKLYCTRSRRH